MLLLKLFLIAGIVMAVSANSTINIDSKSIEAISDVVKRSNTCVVLVIDSRIKLIANQINDIKQLTAYRDVVNNTKFVFIKSAFKPRSVKDIAVKLTKIGKMYDTFLAYFRVPNKSKPIKGSITTEITRPVGLLVNLLAGLGIREDEDGLLTSVLSSLGINTNVKDINSIEFEFMPLNISNSTKTSDIKKYE